MSTFQRILVHVGATVALAAIFVLLSGELRDPVRAVSPPSHSDAQADILDALEYFGADRLGNFCPTLFGGPEMRADLVGRVRVLWAELESRHDPEVEALLRGYAGGEVFAWVDADANTVYVTNRFWAQTREYRRATLFHEVRGHIEMGYTDNQMRAALCPAAAPGDSHCITIEISRGCPALRGLSSEQALARANRAPGVMKLVPPLRRPDR